MAALCNGAGRLFWGNMLDVFGFKSMFSTLAAIQVRVAFLILVVSYCVALITSVSIPHPMSRTSALVVLTSNSSAPSRSFPLIPAYRDESVVSRSVVSRDLK